MDAAFNLLLWFAEVEHAKPFVLVLFFITFVGILIYVFGGKKRGQRLEAEKYAIFEEDSDLVPGQSQKEDARHGKSK